MAGCKLLQQITSKKQPFLHANRSHEAAKVEIRILLYQCDFANVIFAAAREANEEVVLSELLLVGEISFRRHSSDVVQVELVAVFVDIIGSKDLDAAFGYFVLL